PSSWKGCLSVPQTDYHSIIVLTLPGLPNHDALHKSSVTLLAFSFPYLYCTRSLPPVRFARGE
ncbi:MAG: hypothetical protein J7K51_03580, partial [Thermotogae bacterium]|nr:hypothetical protein [Thermotogota bacterium]